MSYYDSNVSSTAGPRQSTRGPRRTVLGSSINIGPADPIAAYEATERELESALNKRLRLTNKEDAEGRTPFLAYISKGLYSREWYGLVRAEVRSLSLRTFVQRFMIEHRRDYKYASMLFKGFSAAAPGGDAPSTSIDQLSMRERLYVTRLRADAFAAASTLPDIQVPVPFGKLLVSLCKWKLGSGVLSAEERLYRELRLSQYYSEMMAARVQALIKGYLLRRRIRFQRTRAAIALVQRWWRFKKAQQLLAGNRITSPQAASHFQPQLIQAAHNVSDARTDASVDIALAEDNVYDSLQDYLVTGSFQADTPPSNAEEPVLMPEDEPQFSLPGLENVQPSGLRKVSPVPRSLFTRLDAARKAGEFGGEPRLRTLSIDSSDSEA
jgi:hypothetical protein